MYRQVYSALRKVFETVRAHIEVYIGRILWTSLKSQITQCKLLRCREKVQPTRMAANKRALCWEGSY